MQDRFGVINTKERENYEKQFQLCSGYVHMTFDEKNAIKICRNLIKDVKVSHNKYFVVERIFDTKYSQNNKEIIFKSEENV
jgi:hypothetical protein